MLYKAIGAINSSLLTFLFAIGLPLASCFTVRKYIMSSLLGLLAVILFGNLIRIIVLLQEPLSVFAIAQL